VADLQPIGLQPTTRAERISSIDLLRGFSLLGILLMNVIGFAFPGTAYFDPSSIGGSTGANLWVWAINYILFEGKMRAIFSMLFGAGIIIFTSRLEQRGAGLVTADLYYRRMLWLIVFGMTHAYLFWGGDVLYPYGVTALILFAFRKLKARTQIVLGLLVLAATVPGFIAEARNTQALHDRAATANASAKDKQDWDAMYKRLKPTREAMQPNIEAHRGGFIRETGYRAPGVTQRSSYGFYTNIFFDCCGIMLVGMGLYQLGYFSARRTYAEYAMVGLLAYTVGIAANTYVVIRQVATNFDPLVNLWAESGYHFERLAVGLGHASLVMIVAKAGVLQFLTSRIAAIGQMALTSYFTHTLIGTTIFDRLGYYGQWQRYQVYYVVAAIWVFQLIVSKPWLEHFQFGPMEWMWRSLTYWKRQPMRIAVAERAAAAAAD
jgi:uncharacterized protein